MKSSKLVALDPTVRGEDYLEFENNLRKKVIGQDDAVIKTTEVIQKYLSGFSSKGRPIANLLFLGPTGVGKTHLVESVSDILFSDRKAVVKISCAEFQASHDIAKLIGAPPGYIGHNDKSTKQLIDQEKLDKYSVEGKKLALVLFDEIEKSSDALWNLLLGITDRAEMTNSVGSEVNFENSIIFMTSNLGAAQMEKELGAKLGFHSGLGNIDLTNIATGAAKRTFKPEFINRLDNIVVFQSLKKEELLNIARLELVNVQRRIFESDNHIKFAFTYDDSVLNYLLSEGMNHKYGARNIKRTVEKHIMVPLINLVMSGQLDFGDSVIINTADKDGLKFSKASAKSIRESDSDWPAPGYSSAVE